MKTIGLITYHSAYNFGSFLQAYATQETIRKIVGNCEIVNYRSDEQKRVYSILKWDKDHILKSMIKNLLFLSKYKKYLERKEAYERLFQDKLDLSKECAQPDEVEEMWNKYDILVSGSDQIWNKHSNELEYVSWEFMDPYLLKGYSGRKVSYASSPANMSDEELKRIAPALKEFDALSVRELRTADKLSKILEMPVKTVLDPTFLFDREEWISRLGLKCSGKEPYILYYALSSVSELLQDKRKLEQYSKKTKMPVKVLSPISIFPGGRDMEVIINASPVDFLNLILNAKIIITDSYHGTILSVNLGRSFFSICKNKGSDFRKTDILERLGLADRVIGSIDEAVNKDASEIDYKDVDKRLKELRKESMEYLRKALET